MKRMDTKLRTKILDRIKPNKKEQKQNKEIVDTVIKTLEKNSKKQNIDCTFFIGGSFGKNTYLKTSSDVDIFVRFSLKYKDSQLSIYTKNILDKTQFNYKTEKGSRDYFSFKFKNIKFELVPNRHIKNPKDATNSTDVSPMHVDFLKEKSKTNKKLNDEIRLAKQYFKSKELYGAESYINGFSGHVIDILIAHYKSLDNLLKDAKNWTEEHFIDINSSYKSESIAKKQLSKEKLSQLILIDPIIKTRNASKALNQANYSKFLLIAQNFTKLIESDFIVNEFDLHDVIKGGKKFTKINNLRVFFYIFNINQSNASQDIIGSKLLKLNSKFNLYFKEHDFNIFKNDFFIDFNNNLSLFVFFFEKQELSKIKKILGPKVFMRDAVERFLAKRTFFFVENDRVYTYENRKYTKIDDIALLTIEDCKDMSSKDMSFIKKLKVIRK